MGCAASRSSCKKGGIRLMATRLTFTKGQLCNLNTYFRKLVDEAENDVSNPVFAIEATVEKLIQRLMRRASTLDPRFSSVFLVSLNEPRRIKRLRFEYLLRIDALSSSSSNRPEQGIAIEEDASSPGFVHLKILGIDDKEIWREYVDVAGRLRRDLVKAKLANLLATAIKRDTPIDPEDDRVCVSPGQVVDADILDKILKQPDHCRIFYGPGISDESLPARRRNRVAMIEDSEGILVRIGVDGVKSGEVEVRLLIGIGLSSWPASADYPQRIPLYHCDALLHYTAAQSGMYAVAVGPYSGARCENRATLWRVRVPAAEKIMRQHYASDSVPSLTESVLLEILYELREGRVTDLSAKPKVKRELGSSEIGRLRVVSRHILRTVHRWRLERGGPDPLTSWAPDTLSCHVLLALDELVAALKCQSLRCYLHPRCNVMLQCVRGGIPHHEDSYASDCRSLESYLETLRSYSFSITGGVARPVDLMENELIVRWREIMAALPGRRESGNDDYHGYSERQFEYLTMIVEQALGARDALLQEDNRSYSSLPQLSYCATERVESLVFLLRLVSTQAWARVRVVTERETRESRRKRRWDAAGRFDYSVGLLIDAVRRDRETANTDLESTRVMTKMLLHWLHLGMDNDRKILEPVLRPYLNNLFNGTREHGWLASSWRRRQEIYRGEMGSLSMFCKSVVTEEITPGHGIVDYLSKGWRWAENMARMIERSGNCLRLIFLAPGDKAIKFDLTFAGNKGPSSFSTWTKVRSVSTITRRRRRSACSRASELFDSLTGSQSTPSSSDNNGVAGHTELRDASPLTYVASMSRSRARHRGPGDLISAILSLGKFRVVQEAAAFLPREERVVVLDAVQRVAREFSRRSRKTGSVYTSNSPRQLYRARPESDLLDSPPPLSPEIRERRIIAEHQKQLEKEIQEMHDTLRRNAMRRQLSSCNTWDSNSLSSFNSSIDSIMGTITLRRYRTPIWDAIKGNSPARSSLRENHNTGESKFNTEMISREESPTWSTRIARSKESDYAESKNEDELPSWDTLEATLNRRLCNYGNVLPESLETDEGVGKKVREDAGKSLFVSRREHF